MAKLPRNASQQFKRYVPMPDDPTSLSKDQVDAMLGMVRARILTPGTRVRIHTRSERLNGLTGVVKSATETAAWVVLDPEGGPNVGADYPEELRFGEDELEPIREAQEADPDAPEPYAAALDYITPLKDLHYKQIAGSWHRYMHGGLGYPWKGSLQVRVTPWGTAAYVAVGYRSQTLHEDILHAAFPAIDILDVLREIEIIVKSASSISDLTQKFRDRAWKGSRVETPDRVKSVFGESMPDQVNPDDADVLRYVNDLQDHARVIQAFFEVGFRMRRRPHGESKSYEMFSRPLTVYTDLTYTLFLEPLTDGAWSISADGTKYFDTPDGEQAWENFEIPESWDLPPEPSDQDISRLAERIWYVLPRKYRGPDEYTPDPIGESADDIDFDAYAKEAAGYNPVQLLTSKEIRAWVRELGLKVNTLYHSKRTTGWNVTATPVTDEAFEIFKTNHTVLKYKAETHLEQQLLKRFPSFNRTELNDKVWLNVWTWPGGTSADPESRNNYVLYIDIQPTDHETRKGGLPQPPVKEALEEIDDYDPAAYAKTTYDPVAFLEAAGWVKDDRRPLAADGGAYKKIIPLPMAYVMGRMTFTKLKLLIYILGERDRSVHVAIYFVNDDESGLPVGNGWTVIGQKRFEFDGLDDALGQVERGWDTTMPLRKFAVGIGPLLSTIKWPDKPHSTLMAASNVENAVSKFVADLNNEATKPLGPAPQQEGLDPDAPDAYVNSLGTLSHIMASYGFRQPEGAKAWVRPIQFHHQIGVQSASRSGTGGRETTYFSGGQVMVTYNPAGFGVMIVVSLRNPLANFKLWWRSHSYKSEAAAVWHLNETLPLLFQSLDDTNEPHDVTRLRDIIDLGVAPFLIRAPDEDEDPQ